jgi:hypothetical protein
VQRDVVASHIDSGRPVDEEGVEDAFELLHEMNERVRTGIWVGDCFIYNNSSWRLNYCVGGEVLTCVPSIRKNAYFLLKYWSHMKSIVATL